MFREQREKKIIISKQESNLLCLSAVHGQLKEVKRLLSEGASIDIKDQYGNTPLHAAAWSGNVKGAKFLLQRGANVNVKNQFGFTPLHSASYNGHVILIYMLIRAKD